MANSVLTGRVINLDDFSAAVTLPCIKLFSITWSGMTTLDHTCTITHGVDGLSVIEWVCTDVSQSWTAYFPLQAYSSIDIAAGAVESGKLIILVR